MHSSPFKTILLALFSGAAGGAVSGGSYGTMLTLYLLLPDLAMGNFASLFWVIPVGLYGVAFGLAAGLIAGLLSGILLSTLFRPAHAAKLGVLLGGMVGFGVAIFLANDSLMSFLTAGDLHAGFVTLLAGFGGAISGMLGGGLAGRMFVWMMGAGRRGVSAEIKSMQVSAM